MGWEENIPAPFIYKLVENLQRGYKLKLKKYFFMVILILLILLINTSISSALLEKSSSYTYNFRGESVPGPPVYKLSENIGATDLGVEALDNPRDIFARKNNIYITDSGNNRIIIYNLDSKETEIIDNFTKEGNQEKFNEPQGIYVTDNDELYIADTENSRIVVLNNRGEFIKEITAPADEEVGYEFDYYPQKVVVDKQNRVYVIARGILEGIFQYDRKGVFSGFVGAPEVRPNPVDYFWYSIMTGKQKDQMIRFIPTDYSNLDLSEEGFIYTTVAGGKIRKGEAVRKLTPAGNDILDRGGFHLPVGDVNYPEFDVPGSSIIKGPSRFIDITALEEEKFSVLDEKRKRIFTYDKYGNLLYAFGGPGDEKSRFSNPVAIENMDHNILILDANWGLKIFKPTEYSRAINKAISNYGQGRYKKASGYWKKTLKYNPNFSLAYRNIGRSLMRDRNFGQALENFRLAEYREGYSKAFEEYRREIILEKFDLIMSLIISIFLIGVILYLLNKKTDYFSKKIKKEFSNITYPFYYIFHPFSGSWELKKENRGSFISANVIILLVIFTFILRRQYTGFLFNYNDLQKLNIFMEFVSIFIPFIIWCGVNWSLTTLMDGKGTLKDIYITTAYGLTPLILINIPLMVISNYLTLKEEVFYQLLIIISILWAFSLVFFGNMVIHQYAIFKMLFTTVMISIGFAVILFLTLLYLNVIDELLGFVRSIYSEITYLYGG